MKYFTVLFCTMVCFFSFASHQNIQQWQVSELTFKAKPSVKNPFTTDFSATFIHTNGDKKIVPGFYNGNNEWLVRFSFSKTGNWSYTTSSEIKKLDGKTGQVNIITNTRPEKHGGIVLNKDDPQRFYYEDGSHYMQMAFECDWLFALDFHNKESASKTTQLLNHLEENNLNQIVTTVYSFGAKWKRDPRLKEHPEYDYSDDLSIYPFLGTNENPDFSELNLDYFKQMDRTITLMEERNISLHLMIYVWNKLVTWPHANTEADNMFFDYIIKRYQAYPNMVWDIAKEAYELTRCSPEYILERIDRVRELDAHKRLVSVHEYDFCIKHPESVDFIAAQNWSATIYHDMLEVTKKFPNKPVFNIEHGGYEDSPYEVFPGDYVSPEICLRRNYLINFSGTYSTYYWQGASWYVIIHNPFEQPNNFIKPKFEYYKHFVDFFNKYPFNEFEPNLKSNNSGYTLTNNKGTFLMYLPKYNYQASIYWQSPFFSKTGTYQWFNTLTGEYSEVFQFKGGNFKNPWFEKADAILIRKHK